MKKNVVFRAVSAFLRRVPLRLLRAWKWLFRGGPPLLLQVFIALPLLLMLGPMLLGWGFALLPVLMAGAFLSTLLWRLVPWCYRTPRRTYVTLFWAFCLPLLALIGWGQVFSLGGWDTPVTWLLGLLCSLGGALALYAQSHRLAWLHATPFRKSGVLLASLGVALPLFLFWGTLAPWAVDTGFSLSLRGFTAVFGG